MSMGAAWRRPHPALLDIETQSLRPQLGHGALVAVETATVMSVVVMP